MLLWARGNQEQTLALLERGLTIYRKLSDLQGMAVSLELQAAVTRDQGKFEQTAVRLALFRILHGDRGAATALHNLGRLAQSMDNNLRATELFEESLALAREVGSPQLVALIVRNLGLARCFENEQLGAVELINESLALVRSIGDEHGEAYCLRGLGMLAEAQSYYKQAADLYTQILRVEYRLRNLSGVAWCLERIAGLQVKQAHEERAIVLFGAAAIIREQRNISMAQSIRPKYDQDVTIAQAALGETAFSTLWMAGRAMTVEQAVAEILGEQPEEG